MEGGLKRWGAPLVHQSDLVFISLPTCNNSSEVSRELHHLSWLNLYDSYFIWGKNYHPLPLSPGYKLASSAGWQCGAALESKQAVNLIIRARSHLIEFCWVPPASRKLGETFSFSELTRKESFHRCSSILWSRRIPWKYWTKSPEDIEKDEE